MLTPTQFAVSLLAVFVIFYLVFATRRDEEYDSDDEPEYFDEKPTPSSGDTSTLPVVTYDLQKAIDFSDVTITDQQRTEYNETRDCAEQMQSVDERFQAAKRRTQEHGLRPGVLTQKRRRELTEALVRRPFCGRRTRSWRTEFSDTLRGDVVPKNTEQGGGMGMMRIGRADPTKDLHPGALGQMSGLSGRWVSEENLPDNAFDDLEDDGEL